MFSASLFQTAYTTLQEPGTMKQLHALYTVRAKEREKSIIALESTSDPTVQSIALEHSYWLTCII